MSRRSAGPPRPGGGRGVRAAWPTPRPGPPPLCIAHRGSRLRAPENTLAAFERAIAEGADGFECDVRLTGDGVPVILHDATLDRTTDGRGPLSSVTLAGLRRLDAGAWFAPRFRGERVPTLEEALALARGRCGVILEMKCDAGRGARRRSAEREEARRLAQALARVVRRTERPLWLVVSSFSRAALDAARLLLPEAPRGLLVSRSALGVARAARRLRLYALHPHARLATTRRLSSAHRLGLAVHVWGADDERRIRALARRGADGLMTDDPRLFRILRPQHLPDRREPAEPPVRGRRAT